ncbi:DUF397 domain-containing protein [Streptomyces sp. NPDC049577]|uniref:DUF397 domain-containing protein n=1 Tax=Streptomyces sp. NPDC049577 TaxID=3155153 RepID=UPI0034476733
MSPIRWQKSSYCSEGDACLSAARAVSGVVKLRESEDPDRVLTATPAALRSLLRAVKEG